MHLAMAAWYSSEPCLSIHKAETYLPNWNTEHVLLLTLRHVTDQDMFKVCFS